MSPRSCLARLNRDRLRTSGGQRHRMAKKAFDRTELLRIFGCNKARGPSGRFHPGRPADSMNVILRAIR